MNLRGSRGACHERRGDVDNHSRCEEGNANRDGQPDAVDQIADCRRERMRAKWVKSERARDPRGASRAEKDRAREQRKGYSKGRRPALYGGSVQRILRSAKGVGDTARRRRCPKWDCRGERHRNAPQDLRQGCEEPAAGSQGFASPEDGRNARCEA